MANTDATFAVPTTGTTQSATGITPGQVAALDRWAAKAIAAAGWTTCNGRDYATEASEWQRPAPCPMPGCRVIHRNAAFTAIRDREGEIVEFKAHCACGATLHVFND